MISNQVKESSGLKEQALDEKLLELPIIEI